MTEQLPLPLRLGSPLPQLASFDFEGQGLLLRELAARRDGAVLTPLLLQGVAGTGKSHLLGAQLHAWLERDRPARLLPLRTLRDHAPGAFGLESQGPGCWLLDDLDAVLGNREWELALFALLNRQHDAQQPLLASVQRLPEAGAFALPDLCSRLAQLTRIELAPLDAAARRRLLKRRAQGLGLELSDAVLDWLEVHVSRELRRLLEVLTKLDRYSLSRGRRLTVPLVREWLQRAPQEPGAELI